jgi:uncharacterized protein YcbX
VSLTLTHIWRHPLKAIGREAVAEARLTPGAWLPHDRIWAVAHDNAKLSGGWALKANFLRGVTEPALMAATSQLGEDGATLKLDHPDAGQITIRPDAAEDTPVLLDWLTKLWPTDLPAPKRIYRADAAHLTDAPDPWISIHTWATHRAVEDRVGQPLSIHRWRGNLWLDGAAAWDEFGWIGKRIAIGTAVLEVKDRITRCKATMSNPETGVRDADTLAALRTWGHQDFGVFAEVVESGRIAPADTARVLS